MIKLVSMFFLQNRQPMTLKHSDRYSTQGLTEGQFEASSKKRVYKNLLGVTSKQEMDKLEFHALVQASLKLFSFYDDKHQFTAKDIKKIHKIWLSKIYSWAGKYRQINLSKGGFPFAAANQIPKLMKELEKNELKKFTPCCFNTLNKAIKAMAVVHTELVLIHPFREGNGRMSRILANLMALQAGLPVLNFGALKGQTQKKYFAAVRAGLNREYQPMIKIFEAIVKRTLKKYKQRQ